MNIKEISIKIHENAVNKGFWDTKREFGTLIALIHSELSEALEGDRKEDYVNVGEELADVFIRLCDVCVGYGYDLEKEVLSKMEKNKNRPKMHGKKY